MTDTITQGFALNQQGGIRAFDDGCPIDADEVAYPDYESATAAQAVNPSAIHAALVASAQNAMDKVTGSSGTIIRCVVAGVAVPAAWTAYVVALRAIVNGTDTTSTALPNVPAYPAGT
jgi:hypothetical protein